MLCVYRLGFKSYKFKLNCFSDKGQPSQLLVIVAVAVPAVFVVAAMIVFCCLCRRKKNVKHTKAIQMENRALSAKKVN